MKTKVALSVLLALAFSGSVLANTPASYDTKFNVSANVPDSAHITDPSGKPVTDLDVVLTPADSGKMEAMTGPLKLWNNDVSKLEVSLIMDDAQSATGSAFTLYSDTMVPMQYAIEASSNGLSKSFPTSGSTQDYTLNADGTHGELPIRFKFVSTKDYTDLGQGNYTGVVYANVNAKA